MPILLIAVGLLGSLLGLVGAAGVAAAKRIVHGPQSALPASETKLPLRRGLLLMGGGLTWAVSLVIVSSVIPGLRADTFVHAAPQRAATGFIYCAALNVAIGAVLLALARWRKVAAAQPLAAMAGVLALFLGVAIVQAIGALWGHGPGMRGVVMASILCAAGDLAAGTLLLMTALRRQRTAQAIAARP